MATALLLGIFAVSAIVLVLNWYLKNYYRQVILAFRLKGPTAYPLIGNLGLINAARVISESESNPRKKYGGLFRLWVPVIPIFVLIDHSYVQAVLSSKAHNTKAHLYTIFTKLLGPRSLLLSNGPEMSRKRKLQQRLFTTSAYETYLTIMWTVAKTFVKAIEKDIDEDQNIVKKSNQCIKNISNCLMLGISPEELNNDNVEKLITRQVHLLPRLAKPWLLLKGLYKRTSSYEHEDSAYQRTMDFLHRRALIIQEELNSRSVERLSLMRNLIELEKETPDYSAKDVLDDTLTYLVAGSDATASGVSFILYELAKHPEYQEKCYQEQKEIFGDSDEAPTPPNIREMKFLEQCINESLRLHPPIPLIARKIGEDVQLGKTLLPAGSTVVIPIYAIHYDEDTYPNSKTYDPDRFLPENIDKRPKGSFIPFSTGPRYCPGNQLAMLALKSLTSAVIRNYTLHLVDGKEDTQHMFRITLQAHKGIWIKVKRRSKSLI